MNSAWFDLPNAARDGVSGLAYANDALLAASSWDGSLYFYNTDTAALDTKVDTGAPLLDLAWVNEEYIITGGLQRMVTRYVQRARAPTRTNRVCPHAHPLHLRTLPVFHPTPPLGVQCQCADRHGGAPGRAQGAREGGGVQCKQAYVSWRTLPPRAPVCAHGSALVSCSSNV
ncbi:MAG: hypothetical protein EOO65_00370 [Methanosarcinales archaeon]|nr:MAG: hypothetical protein EOO65_00370 [Methanosarcinales archaeon]